MLGGMGIRIVGLLRGGVLGIVLAGCVERDSGDSGSGDASTGGATDAGTYGTSTSGDSSGASSTGGATTLDPATTGGEATTGTGAGDTGTSTGSTGEVESSSGSTGTTGGEMALGFDTDVWPIVAERCGCHLDGNGAGKLELAKDVAYDNLVGQPSNQADKMLLVAPGDVEASYLWFKLNNTQKSVGGSGKRMPPGGALDPADIEVVAQWIADGAMP